MTKNHILIKSIALGVLLMLTPFAKANNVDRALVTYFNVLYKNQSPKCSLDEATKGRIIGELESKCLIRKIVDNQQFISGVKSPCTEASVKSTVDVQVDALCVNTAQKAEQAALVKAQANAAAQPQSAVNKSSGGGSSTDSLKAAKLGIKTIAAAEKIWNDDKPNDKTVKTIEEKIPEKAKEDFRKSEIQKQNAAAKAPEVNQAVATPVATATVEATDLPKLENAASAANAEAKAELPNTPPSVAGPAAEMLGQTAGSVGADAANATQATTDATASADATFTAKITQALTTAQTCVGPSNAMITKIQAAVKARDLVKAACSKSNAAANFLCPMTTSPQALKVQKIMSLGAAVLSNVTAASEACGTTSNISKIAQAGMLLGQVTCASSKFACDLSCAKAETQKTAILGELKAADEAIKAQIEIYTETYAVTEATTCTNAQLGAIEATTLITADGAPVIAKVTECKAHSASLALMGSAALGLLSASLDSKKCKEQLSAGGGSGGKSTSSLAGPSMTTAEYCSQPQNVTSVTCKCTANPNAEGCMGSLAKSGVNIGKIGNNGGASAFASAGQNGLGAINPLGKAATGSEEPAPGANLSEAAREALGIGATPDSGAGSAAAGVSTNAAEAAKAKEEKEKPKFGFFSSLGNMISGGRKPDQAANATIRKHEQDQAIKRKLASDQVRAEISTASGKSNFDKIRSRYQQNAASFEQ